MAYNNWRPHYITSISDLLADYHHDILVNTFKVCITMYNGKIKTGRESYCIILGFDWIVQYAQMYVLQFYDHAICCQTTATKETRTTKSPFWTMIFNVLIKWQQWLSIVCSNVCAICFFFVNFIVHLPRVMLFCYCLFGFAIIWIQRG